MLRELEEAKDDESFLDEECEDRWTEADKRLMGPLLGKNYWHFIFYNILFPCPVCMCSRAVRTLGLSDPQEFFSSYIRLSGFSEDPTLQ